MSRQTQRGETLVGLLVGLAVGLLVLAAAANMLAQLFRAQRLSLQDSHAQQDLQWAITLIARELQNAQYVANGAQDNDECTGLRLNAGALQVRTACSPEVWSPLSDTSVLRVSRLDMQLQCLPRAGWVQRSLRLRVEAQTPAPSQQTLVLERQVPLRNALPEAARASFCP